MFKKRTRPTSVREKPNDLEEVVVEEKVASGSGSDEGEREGGVG